jgi:hypothetical protein
MVYMCQRFELTPSKFFIDVDLHAKH